MRNEWKPRSRSRHACRDHAPSHVPEHIENGDRWRCPSCGRRWQVTPNRTPHAFPGQPYEGVFWNGPDGSQYWRPYLARFIGYPCL